MNTYAEFKTVFPDQWNRTKAITLFSAIALFSEWLHMGDALFDRDRVNENQVKSQQRFARLAVKHGLNDPSYNDYLENWPNNPVTSIGS